jgi:hypothetical protein
MKRREVIEKISQQAGKLDPHFYIDELTKSFSNL